jgi:hypothetical protein
VSSARIERHDNDRRLWGVGNSGLSLGTFLPLAMFSRCSPRVKNECNRAETIWLRGLSVPLLLMGLDNIMTLNSNVRYNTVCLRYDHIPKSH